MVRRVLPSAVDGNDWELKALRIDLVSQSPNHALVRASFNNFKRPTEILFDIVPERGRWAIDEIRSMHGPAFTKAGWTMSKILTHAPDAFLKEGK